VKKKLCVRSVVALMMVAIMVLILLTGCGKKVEPTKITIGYQSLTVNLPLFCAVEQGYFKDHNLTVELVAFETTNQIVDALLTGKIDMSGIIAYQPLLSVEAQTQGRFKIFAANQETATGYIDLLVMRTGLAYTRLADLAGLTIGMNPGSSTRAIVTMMLKTVPGLVDQVTLVEIPAANQVAALQSNQVQGLFTLEPFATIAASGGAGFIAERSPFSKYVLNNFTLGAAAFSANYAANNPKQVTAAVAAFNEGIQFLRTNPTQARAFLPKYTPVSQAVADQVALGNVVKLQDIDVKSMQDLADIYTKAGELPGTVTARNMLYLVGK